MNKAVEFSFIATCRQGKTEIGVVQSIYDLVRAFSMCGVRGFQIPSEFDLTKSDIEDLEQEGFTINGKEIYW